MPLPRAAYWILSTLALSLACGGDSPSINPISPTPPIALTPTPTPPPPMAVLAQIGGAWTGTHELQFEGVRFFGTILLTLDQTDRTIRGTWRHAPSPTDPGYRPWHGDLSGTLTLTNTGETRFSGTATIIAEIATGTGACHGTVAMEGASSASALRWTGPNVQFSDCQNVVGGFVWIVHR